MMKNAVHAAGLRVARHRRISSVSELELILKEKDDCSFSFPVVIKTPQGFYTTDVFICSSFAEAVDAVNRICCVPKTRDNKPSQLGPDSRRVQHAILEEYINGIEFAVNLMVLDSKLVATDVWRYHKNDRAQYQMAEIRNLCSPELEVIIDYAIKVAKAVGIQNGAAHIELKAKEKKNTNHYSLISDDLL
jgi:biotin carboxylase